MVQRDAGRAATAGGRAGGPVPDLRPVGCPDGQLDAEQLVALNRSPLAFLATCGVRHGVPFGRAFLRAQAIVDQHGTSRRIDAVDAARLCHAMCTWAEADAQTEREWNRPGRPGRAWTAGDGSG